VLRETTSADLKSLQEYWNQRIKNLALKLEREDRQLLEEYNTLKVASKNKYCENFLKKKSFLGFVVILP